MAEDIYVYLIDMPTNISEMITPCSGGYTVYLNARKSYSERVQAYLHALRHVERGDFDYDNCKTIQQIEYETHKEDT